MATYSLEPDGAALHGVFSRDLPPALTIDSGDTVRFRTLDAGWNLEPHEGPGRIVRQVRRDKPGHALTGPVAVRGAEPGMTLEVRVDRLVTAPWGWTRGGDRPTDLDRRLGVAERPAAWLLWALDREAMTARNQHGHTVRMRPFMGVMGMPPPEPGDHPTGPPRRWGGNLDCRELVEGSRLFLPVPVPGALFSCGDGHGAQGDGEVSGTAIECPMEVCELTFTLHAGRTVAMPAAETPAGTVTMGLDDDLNEAMAIALVAMVDIVQERFDLDRPDALALASVVVDLRVTQVANQVWGVHALLPPGVAEVAPAG